MSQTPDELSRIQAIHERIARARELEARYAQDTSAQGQIAYRRAQELLVSLERRRKIEQESLVNQQTLNKELATFSKSYAKLSSTVKAQLQTQSSVNTQTSIYKSIGEEIAKSKAREANLSGDALEHEQERGALMAEISSSLLSQAKVTAKAIDDAAGLTEFDKMRRDLKESILHLSDEERQKLEDAISQTEELYKKEQRILELKSQQEGIVSQLPSGIQSMIGFVQKLGAAIKAGFGPLFLIGAILAVAIKSFIDLDSAAADFRKETGLTNSQMEGIKSQANEITTQFGSLGVEAKDVFNTVAALKSEFSDIAEFGDEVVAGLTVLNKNFGVSAESAAKVQGVFEQIGGLSSETATSLQLQVAQLSKAAGVAPAKVMADIAESAEVASTLFKGDVKALSESAVQARRLGTNLKSVAATAEKLLDFEGGIEDELTAATYVGGQFNLSRARALAFEGKIVEANKETLAQIQRSGDFRKKDYFTQQQLAKAAGMSVEEINKQLDAQEKLNSLSDEQKKLAEDAINAGLDITNIDKENLATQVEAFSKQQEQQATMERISNAFTGIASTVGGVLMPLIEGLGAVLEFVLTPITAIAKGMADFVGFLKESLPLMSALVAGAATYLYYKNEAFLKEQGSAALSLLKIGYETTLNGIVAAGNLIKKKGLLGAIAEMAMRAFSSLSAIPFIGPVLGAAAAAGALALGYSYYSKAGDIDSPADGKTRVSTKEGGLFELSPNDDLVAGPGASDAMGGKGGGMNLSVLAAPLQAVVSEIKALRADLSAGKIAVYMDAQKVTNGVSKTVDQSTRNSYNLGTV